MKDDAQLPTPMTATRTLSLNEFLPVPVARDVSQLPGS
jgi:hypothetical protein